MKRSAPFFVMPSLKTILEVFMEWMLAIGTAVSKAALGRLYETIRSIFLDGALEIVLEREEIEDEPLSRILVHEIIVSARGHGRGFRLCVRAEGSLDSVHRLAQLCSMIVEGYVVNVWALDRSVSVVALTRYTAGVLIDSRTVPAILMGGDESPDGAVVRVGADAVPALTGDTLLGYIS